VPITDDPPEDLMALEEKLAAALNQQVGNELAASNQYVAIAAYFDAAALAELAKFFYLQAEEEREHAMKFVKFVIDAGASLAIPEIRAPQAQFESAREAVALALHSEETVTKQIYSLVDIAKESSNYIAMRFLDWFVDEQFEEEATIGALLQVVERAGEEQLLLVEDLLARGGGQIEGPAGPE